MNTHRLAFKDLLRNKTEKQQCAIILNRIFAIKLNFFLSVNIDI